MLEVPLVCQSATVCGLSVSNRTINKLSALPDLPAKPSRSIFSYERWLGRPKENDRSLRSRQLFPWIFAATCNAWCFSNPPLGVDHICKLVTPAL